MQVPTAASGRFDRVSLAPYIAKDLGLVPIRRNGQERPLFGHVVPHFAQNKLLHRMPPKWPFLAISSDWDEFKVFCYLERETSTIKTAGCSRWDLYSHPDPILFTVWTPHRGGISCEQNGVQV